MRTLVTTAGFHSRHRHRAAAIARHRRARLVAEGLSLPRDHQYERYDAARAPTARLT